MPTAEVDVRAALAEFDDAAESVEPAASQELPPGDYQVEIQRPKSGNLVSVDSDGATRARVTVECVEAAEELHVGTKDSESWTIIRDGELQETSLSYLKGFLRMNNLTLESLADLEDVLAETVGNIVEINVYKSEGKNGRVYKNMSFKSLVSTGEEDSAEY